MITLSPLSPPSTELVSITLDLIVIVDRLLTLLRQRSELIDLCRLRLKWEALRSQCLQDCDRFSTDVDDIVTDYLDWLPGTGQTAPSDLASVNDTKRSPVLSSQISPSDTRSAAPYTPPAPTKYGGSPSTSPNSSFRMRASPSMNKLRLPLIRSRIESLQIRYDTLSLTSAPRLGAMVDKMIDTAAPLKTNDVAQGSEHTGAVPEYLLDAQDDLEVRVSGLSSTLDMCRLLEKRWAR